MSEVLNIRDEIRGLVEAAENGSVELPKHLTDHVWYVKYESTNPLLSDTRHGALWSEQVTASDRMGITEDDGCIIDFSGNRRGEVAITEDGNVLTDADADSREDATGRALPRYAAFDFRCALMTKTDGPELRRRLQDSADNKVKESQKDLLGVLADTFKDMKSDSAANKAPEEDARSYLQGLDPLQRKAMIEIAEDEIQENGESKPKKQAKQAK